MRSMHSSPETTVSIFVLRVFLLTYQGTIKIGFFLQSLKSIFFSLKSIPRLCILSKAVQLGECFDRVFTLPVEVHSSDTLGSKTKIVSGLIVPHTRNTNIDMKKN